MSISDVSVIAHRLGGAKHRGPGSWMARCPAHTDSSPSLSLTEKDGIILVHCHAGCSQQAVIAALRAEELWPEPPPPASARNGAMPGLTLDEYANAKGLDVTFLADGLGLYDDRYAGAPAVAIPYRDYAGEGVAFRYRLALEGPDRFRWRKGDKPILYGVDRLPDGGTIALVEGESDAQTLWQHGIAAVAVPGANQWNDRRDASLLEKYEAIYTVIENDAGGDALARALANSRLAGRIKVVSAGRFKDASALYLSDPKAFEDRWNQIVGKALPLKDAMEDRHRRERAVLRRASFPDLAVEEDILGKFGQALEAAGVVGVQHHAKLLYLAVTSRLLRRPVSVAVKGPSSGGKSFLVESVLKFFPSEAYFALTAMSDRALAYFSESLRHRMLVLYEAAGVTGEHATYFIRSLLSEGHIRYSVPQPVPPDGHLETRTIEIEGPTGLLITTTAVKLHAENETRLISMTVEDTPQQTQAIMLAQATGIAGSVDYQPWYDLQMWLSNGSLQVVIPFAKALANMIPATSVRLRRDFPALLELIKAHALLHQERHEKRAGAVIAELGDYAAVYDLLADYIQQGVEAAVPGHVRALVKAVAELGDGRHGAALPALAKYMEVDKSSAMRRARAAQNLGFVKNLEDRRGQPARYVLDNQMPDDVPVLPPPGALAAHIASLR